MKTLKFLVFAVLALSMGMACTDFVTPRQEPDNSHERDLLKSKLLGEWVLSDQKSSYIYTFADNDTVYTKTAEGKTIEKWPYQPITEDSIRIVRNNWTTHNKVVFYSNDSIRINDFIPSDAAVYPPMFGDAVLKRWLNDEAELKDGIEGYIIDYDQCAGFKERGETTAKASGYYIISENLKDTLLTYNLPDDLFEFPWAFFKNESPYRYEYKIRFTYRLAEEEEKINPLCTAQYAVLYPYAKQVIINKARKL
jgi:hypothetical protein